MSEESYIFKDLCRMKNAIGNKAIIKTADNKSHAGFIYVIDPVSQSVVLVNETGNSLDIILYNAIISINVVEEPKMIFHRDSRVEDSTGNVEEKKLKLKQWLSDNYVDVKEDGRVLRVGSHIIIEPPYTIDQCYCSNTVILERIQSIINRMPAS